MNRFFEFLTTPYGLFIHFFLLAGVVSGLLYYPMIQFAHREPAPALLPTAASEIQEALSARAEEGAPVPVVEVGFSLNNFAEFSVTKNDFVADGIVWFLFDPDQITLDKLKQFSFDKGTLLQKADPIVELWHDRLHLARFDVRVSFTSNIVYRDFPLDDHRLFLVLKNEHILLRDAVFFAQKENFYIAADVHEPEWDLRNYAVTTGYAKTELRHKGENEVLLSPRVVFSLDYERSGVHLLFVIFIPIIVLFFVTLAVFFIRAPERFDISTTFMGSLFALIGYLFVLETISPNVGYLMLSDLIYITTLIATLVIVILSWLGATLTHARRGIIGSFVEALLIGSFIYILYIWRFM